MAIQLPPKLEKFWQEQVAKVEAVRGFGKAWNTLNNPFIRIIIIGGIILAIVMYFDIMSE